MDSIAAPRFPVGLDDDVCKVGRSVISSKAKTIADAIHHEVCFRRQRGMLCCYQTDQYDTSRTHRWRYVTGPNADWIWIKALTLGTVTNQTYGSLIATTTTDGPENFAHERAAPNPTATLAPEYLSHNTTVQGINDGCNVEDITITREVAYPATAVRILALSCDECSAGEVFTSGAMQDDVYVDSALYRPSRDIDQDDYDDLALGVEYMRRRHKKILHSTCKVLTTTANAPNYQDMYTGSIGNPPGSQLRYDVYPSVNRPETTNVAFTARVYATDSGGAGGAVAVTSSIGTYTVAVGAAGFYTITGFVAKGSDYVTVWGYASATNTLTLESVVVYDATEAA